MLPDQVLAGGRLMTSAPEPDDRLDQIHAIATAWSNTATTSSDYHRALRACSDTVLGILTDAQMGLPL